MTETHIKKAKQTRSLSRQVDLNLLDLFETIYQTRNLTTAGSRLGLTQSAVSRALGRLREMYGDALFVRQQRGVAPTPYADDLAAPITAALNMLRATLRPPTFDHEQQSHTFRIAMSDVGERIFLPKLLEFLTETAPNVVIEAVSTSQEKLQEGLNSGQIHLAVGFFGALSKQVRHKRLFREQFVYIAREDHPLVKGNLFREQLRDLRHIVGGPDGMLHATTVLKVLSSNRVKAPVVSRVHSLLCVAPIVTTSDMVGILPSNLANVVAGNMPLQIIKPPIQFPGFDLTMIWHDRFHRDPSNAWLRETFTNLFESLVV
ncbi:LysR family transcriptional regulator [Limnohabitans sp. Rim8]|uniref:LysR family transcriptional regulator n=1 Tax=Limnohabitans sp. Rim8 TaxID=1100718 RepID=UPI000D391FA1|nr:LysR family transcriptional regulator [Limnohabitans sp. Rim8]PUE56542.1 LysR family transcriptional regulator [Limnohabitans sp. Rim8]